VANSILVKVNQIGSLTETLDAVELAQENDYTGGDQPSVGRNRGRNRSRTSRLRRTPARSRPARSAAPDRVAKYNQLLRIEQALGRNAVYGGKF
jgi:enolase